MAYLKPIFLRRALFDWDNCINGIADCECPATSVAIAEVRGVIGDFKDICQDASK